MLEDQDEILPVDEEHLKIEIHVRAGQHHTVECTTVIEINLKDRYAASTKIRDTVQTLRNGMPIAEIKAEDREHFREVTELVISKGGDVRIAPAGTSKAEKDLAALKKNIPLEEQENGAAAELPSRT